MSDFVFTINTRYESQQSGACEKVIQITSNHSQPEIPIANNCAGVNQMYLMYFRSDFFLTEEENFSNNNPKSDN